MSGRLLRSASAGVAAAVLRLPSRSREFGSQAARQPGSQAGRQAGRQPGSQAARQAGSQPAAENNILDMVENLTACERLQTIVSQAGQTYKQ